MSNIKCSVSSCIYNEDGQVCSAKSIEVNNSSQEQSSWTDMEMADEPGTSSQAETSAETMCQTFKRRS